jgi:formate dehydrogenase major subunit
MDLSRRDFLKLSGSGLGAAAFVNLGMKLPARATDTPLRIVKATESTTVCPYCAVGCGILVRAVNGKVVNTEGNPDHPINQGNLCSKGSSLIQVSYVNGNVNKERLTKPLYRAKGASSWQEITWDDAIGRIAKKIKDTRDSTWIAEDAILDAAGNPTGKKVVCNRTEAIANLGGAALDNEELHLLQKFARGIGLVYVDNQARI